MIIGYYALDSALVASHNDYLVYLSQEELSEFRNRCYSNRLASAQYVYSRLASKFLVSRYTGISPRRISVRSSKDGSPLLLIDQREQHHLNITISHQENRIIVGAFSDCRYGVDVQSLEGVEWKTVEEYMQWSDGVNSLLEQNPLDDYALTRDQIIAVMWACNEACLKSVRCAISASDITWNSITLLDYHVYSGFPIFEISTKINGLDSIWRVFALLSSEFVIAVSYIPSNEY